MGASDNYRGHQLLDEGSSLMLREQKHAPSHLEEPERPRQQHRPSQTLNQQLPVKQA